MAPPDRPRALVVEDESSLRELIAFHLTLEGLEVVAVARGDDAVEVAARQDFDVVLLDLMLPGVDGLTVCRVLRRQPAHADVPILMLTARREESDKVLGLETGADDYVTKPFGVRELMARVRALLRRPRRPAPEEAESVTVVGALRINRERRQAHVDGRALELTPHEFDLLALMAAKPGIVFTRRQLLQQVWPTDTHVTERSVDTLVKRLRQKIESDTSEPRYLLTVWGIGYRLADG